MLAIRIHETGGVETLRVDAVAVPAPGAGEVRLRVEAAGVNFIDTYQRSGLYAVPLPHTLGLEAAGIVTAVGSGVAEFSVGDRVASARVAACPSNIAPSAAFRLSVWYCIIWCVPGPSPPSNLSCMPMPCRFSALPATE